MAHLKQAISHQDNTQAFNEPPLSSLEKVAQLERELLSEPSNVSFDRELPVGTKPNHKNVSHFVSEPVSESPLTPDGELGLIVPNISELQNQLPTTLLESEEYKSESPNRSSNATLDLTNESVSTYVNKSISESQITEADSDTQLVKSSTRETALVNSELLSELLLERPTGESSKYPLVQENTPTHGELIGELLESPPNFVETAEVLEKELGDIDVAHAIDESLVPVNQLVTPKQTSTCEAKEFSVESSLSELPESDSFERVIDELLGDSLGKLSVVENKNHPQASSVLSEPLSNLLGNSLDAAQSKNPLKVPLHLTGAALARRLNLSVSTIRHKKNSRNFGQWTSEHDPDGIAWYFDGQKFISQISPDLQ